MFARRGIALVTALFAVVLLYAFATAMLAQLRGDQALTRDLERRVRARALARSAVQAGLHELNRDPAWEGDHLGVANATTLTLGEAPLRCWVEPTTHPNVVRLRGQCEDQQHSLLLARQGSPGGLLAQAGGELFQANPDGTWTLLPPAPERLEQPTGGPQGEVYAASRRSLYRLEGETWSALAGPEPGEKPKGMAVDGSGRLYVLVKNRIFVQEGSSWRELPAGGRNLKHLSVDDAGRVWVIENHRHPQRYDPALGRWQPVAEPPPEAWMRVQGRARLGPIEREPEYRSAAVDGNGNLYLSGPRRDDIVTLYRFVPEDGDGPTLRGTWRALPAIPKVVLKKQDKTMLTMEKPSQLLKKADNLAVDSAGTLYFRFNRGDDFDTLYRVEGNPLQYGTLEAMPKVKRKNGQQVTLTDNFTKNIQFLGGARRSLAGAPRYVPRHED